MQTTVTQSVVHTMSALPSSTTASSNITHSTSHIAPRSNEDKGIIIGSVLGGIALVLVCLAIILYPILHRHRIAQHPTSPTPTPSSARNTPSRLSKRSSTPLPRPSDLERGDYHHHKVRPVTPSPRRLAIDAAAPSSAHPFGTMSAATRCWDAEKGATGTASVHTPSGLLIHHPVIAWRGNIFGNDVEENPPVVPNRAYTRAAAAEDDDDDDDNNNNKNNANNNKIHNQQGPPPAHLSISTTFAAEMSSLLESISLKSSLSSLRSGGGGGGGGTNSGAVLGVPARLQTPLSVQKLRQDSGATTIGATRGSVSSSAGGGGVRRPSSLLSIVPSRPAEDAVQGGKRNWEFVHHRVRSAGCGEEILVGMAVGDVGCE